MLFFPILELPLDVLNYLTNFLSMIDSQCLRWTCKRLHKIKLPDFKARFIKRSFRHWIEDEHRLAAVDYALGLTDGQKLPPMVKLRAEFCKYLFQTGAIISGSYIQDLLYDTDYHGDIDVYDREHPDGNVQALDGFYTGYEYLMFNQFLYKSGFVSVPNKIDNTMVTGNLHKYQPYFVMGDELAPRPDGYYDRESIYQHRSGPDDYFGRKLIYRRRPERKFHTISDDQQRNAIQLIPVAIDPDRNLRQFILNSYDMDICKSAFDGQKLYVRSWRKLIYKYDYIINTTDVMHSIEYPAHQNQAVKARMGKYNRPERGFKIKLHPESTQIEKYLKDKIGTDNYNCFGKRLKFMATGKIDLEQFHLD